MTPDFLPRMPLDLIRALNPFEIEEFTWTQACPAGRSTHDNCERHDCFHQDHPTWTVTWWG